VIALPSADAFTGRISPLWRGLAAILLLCGLTLALVESRARILRSGTEVRLATAPVDPRDLFRGDYVILNYRISTLDLSKLDGDKSFERNQPAFVRVAPGTDGLAEAKGVYLARPVAGAGETVLEGKVTSTGACVTNANGDPRLQRRPPRHPRQLRPRKLFRAAGHRPRHRDDRQGAHRDRRRRLGFRAGGDQAPADRRQAGASGAALLRGPTA
jgi:hypothetical protein